MTVAPPPRRSAGSLPHPDRPPGTPAPDMPFDHLVVVMMENHSFDNLLGALSRTRPEVDGLSFDAAGVAQNSNPGAAHMPPEVASFPLADTAQTRSVVQNWRATHAQIAGGAMTGFVRASGAQAPMGYYTPEVLPFAYSLASTFTVANRWFCSVPGPTYPNRRFLLAGTAYGATVTGPGTLLDPPPPHGTIFDSLSAHHVNWCDYFTDIPMTSVIPSIVLKHADHHAPITKFFHDCQAGTLPAVSFVDPGVGALSSLMQALSGLPAPVRGALEVLGADFSSAAPAETEEDPQDLYWGEAWAHRVVQAVLQGPRWERTLLIYTYDEHGGYYDHVPPPAAIPPDDIRPKLSPGDPPGGYDCYGPRVPAIVVSPHSRPGGVTDVVHDHTSVLATIQAKWNLPSLTVRDANAETVMDFLDPSDAALLHPPPIASPLRPPGV
ncbi:MAG TPA: alkaline phosphatase family protein [Solirubrobacteraceae bacterium]|nr:alkaline phosphatase family protein [Solirubrobacteraceae bacterium]